MVDLNHVRLLRSVRRGLIGATIVLLGLSFLSYAPAQAANSGASINSSQFRIESLDGTSPITINGSAYRGALQLTPGGGVHVINDVGLEDYVKGISEVPSSWPVEALKAQAIAARTYALWTLSTKSTICPTTSCQVYTGMEKENAPYGDQWVAAAQATAGQVLLYKGAPILAMYSSSSGGHTVNGSKPYLKGVPDPEDSVSPLHKWSFSASAQVVAAANSMSGSINSFSSQSDGIHLSSTGGQSKVISIATLRSQINSNFSAPSGRSQPIPSTNFSASLSGGSIAINGGGYGHRIGMSQYGAKGKAQNGWTASKILSRYYGGIAPSAYPTQNVKVDLGSMASAKITTTTAVRVIDANNNTVAIQPQGSWNVVAQGGSLALQSLNEPPALQVSNMRVDALPTESTSGSIHIDVSAPAVASLDIVDSTGNVVSTQTLNSTNMVKVDDASEVFRTRDIVPPGSVQVATPPISAAGTYSFRVNASSGPGSNSTAQRMIRIAPAVTPSIANSSAWQPTSRAQAPQVVRSLPIGFSLFAFPWLLALASIVGSAAFVRRRVEQGSDPGFTEVLAPELVNAGAYWAESHTVKHLELEAVARATMRPEPPKNRNKYGSDSSLSRH